MSALSLDLQLNDDKARNQEKLATPGHSLSSLRKEGCSAEDEAAEQLIKSRMGSCHDSQ
jgi:hypothetical protein